MESLQWKHSVPASMSWFQGKNPFGFSQGLLNTVNDHGNKRKLPFNDESQVPCKQYLSEEAMTARLNQLHIDNHFSPSSSSCQRANHVSNYNLESGSTQCQIYNVNNTTAFDVAPNLEDKAKHPSVLTESEPPKSQLILSPELAQIQPEPILPQAILDQLKKPSMELVLWKPPVGLLDTLIRSALDEDEPKDQNANDRTSPTNKFQSVIKPYCDNKDSSMHKPFQVVGVVPAMTAMEIESMEEDINVMAAL